MSELVTATEYPKTADLITTAKQRFGKGESIVFLTGDGHVEMVLLDPQLAKELLARQVVERWLADPAAIGELTGRLSEPAQDW